MRSVRSFAFAAAAVLIMGCGGAPKSETRAPELPPLKLQPLDELVPAAGLSWLVTLEPKALLADPEMALGLSEILPRDRLAQFAERNGVELTSLDELVVSARADSSLVLGRGFLDPGRVESAFAKRTIVDGRHLSGAIVHVEARRNEEPERLLIFGPRAAGIERGKAGSLKAAELFALGKIKRAQPALKSEPLATTARMLGTYPARVFFVGPFDDEWSRAGGGLLRTATAIAIGARPVAKGKLEAVLVVAGTFTDAEGAKARLGAALDRLLASDLGHLMGTHQPAEPLRIDVTPDGLRARVVVDAQAFFRGLRDATQATAEDIFKR